MNVETIRLVWGVCVPETNIWQLHRATDMLFVTCHGLVALPPVYFPAHSLIYDRLLLAFHAPSLQLLAVILSCIRESFSDFDVAKNNNNYNDTIDHNRPYILIVWNERLNHESPEMIMNYHILDELDLLFAVICIPSGRHIQSPAQRPDPRWTMSPHQLHEISRMYDKLWKYLDV